MFKMIFSIFLKCNIAILIFIYITSLKSSSAHLDHAVQLFQEYIRINTTTNSDLGPAVVFWKNLARKENVKISVQEYVPGYPVMVLHWPGTDSTLTSIMLNSHMDVVPADEKDGWKYPPFSAHIDEAGEIYGRGAQDMKCLAIQQFQAVCKLKKKKIPLLRDVYMTLMPDEETGGRNGMKYFVKSKQFAAMNVGVEMDEGWAQSDPSTLAVFIKNKAIWQFRVDCYGVAVHGSLMPRVKNTAIGQCLNVVKKLYKFRKEQSKIASGDGRLNAGNFTSLNLNMLSGGSAPNVIAGKVSLIFDARLGDKVDEKQFLAQLSSWISDSGSNISLTFLTKEEQTPDSPTSDNPYWTTLTEAAAAMNFTLKPIVSTGSTDGKYLLAAGIPFYGFSPMFNTLLLAHNVDERLNVDVFLKGIDIYEEVLKNLANMPA